MILILALLALLPAFPQKLHDTCGQCHTSQREDFLSHQHFEKGLSCDACHGQSKPHVEATGHKPPDRIAGPAEQPALCGTCHPGNTSAFLASKHWRLVEARTRVRSAVCTTCHGAHNQRSPVSLTAQCQRCHPALPAACEAEPKQKTAKVSCANCHEQHTMMVAK
jgi:hypothetical protein